jgi:hypothetical protein
VQQLACIGAEVKFQAIFNMLFCSPATKSLARWTPLSDQSFPLCKPATQVFSSCASVFIFWMTTVQQKKTIPQGATTQKPLLKNAHLIAEPMKMVWGV